MKCTTLLIIILLFGCSKSTQQDPNTPYNVTFNAYSTTIPYIVIYHIPTQSAPITDSVKTNAWSKTITPTGVNKTWGFSLTLPFKHQHAKDNVQLQAISGDQNNQHNYAFTDSTYSSGAVSVFIR